MKKGTEGSCTYQCDGSRWVLTGGNPPEGMYCAPVEETCSTPGEVISLPPVAIPEDPSSGPGALNSGSYVFDKKSKTLYFRGGSCSKGKHFKSVITLKELAKMDEKASETIKTIQKNKIVTAFQVVLKAQKIPKS